MNATLPLHVVGALCLLFLFLFNFAACFLIVLIPIIPSHTHTNTRSFFNQFICKFMKLPATQKHAMFLCDNSHERVRFVRRTDSFLKLVGRRCILDCGVCRVSEICIASNAVCNVYTYLFCKMCTLTLING